VYWFRRTIPMTKWFLIPAALSGLAAVAAMESGWIVTEVGRQPWVVYGVLRTSDAVTTARGVPVTLIVTLLIYAVLTGIVIFVPWLMGVRWRKQDPEVPADADPVPYEPVRRRAKQPVG
jgi:cytochrome d ubiquinol oxidase subunit I